MVEMGGGGKLQFIGLRPNSEFGIRNSELSELRSGERGEKTAFYASSKGIDNKGFKKRGGEISVKPFVLAQFRIPHSEFRIKPTNPNLKT